MKNNFKFLIVLSILLVGCICVGSTFAADLSVNDSDDISSVDDANIGIDDSSIQNPNISPLNANPTADIQYLSTETMDIGAVIYNSTYGEGINGKVNTNMSGNVTVVIGKDSTTPLPLNVHVKESGEFNIPFVLPVGNYTDIYVSFISDDGNYIGSSLVNFTIEPHNLEVSIQYSQNGSTGGSVIITIYVTGEDGICPTGSVIMHVKGEDISINLNNCTASIFSDSFNLEDIDYILYSGDDNYDPKIERVKIHFPKLNTTIDIDVGPNKSISAEIVEGDDVSVIVTLNKRATGIVRLSIDGGKTWINVEVINGTAQYIFKGLKAGEYSLIAEYLGDNRYNGIVSETTFIVNHFPKLNTTIDIDVGPNKSIRAEIVEGDDVSVIVTLNKKATGIVRLSIDGGKTWINVEVINGTAQYIFKGLKAGKYTLIVEYLGDNRYNGIVSETTFTVEEAPITPATEENMLATGNPIFVLLFALCAIALESFRRKL